LTTAGEHKDCDCLSREIEWDFVCHEKLRTTHWQQSSQDNPSVLNNRLVVIHQTILRIVRSFNFVFCNIIELTALAQLDENKP